MSLTLYLCSEIEPLAQRLARDVAAPRPDPFVAPRVVAPNLNLQKWLQMRIAEHNGVAANLDFPFLEQGLWDALLALHGAPEPTPALLDRQTLTMMLLSVLLDADRGRPALKPLFDYLGDASPATSRDGARRAWQLCARLAHYFAEYEFQREEMVDDWLTADAGTPDAGKPDDEMVRCQRELYRVLFAPGGLRDRLAEREGRRWLTLPGLAAWLQAEGTANSQDARPLSIFGLSQLSPFHCRLIVRLAKAMDVRMYLLELSDSTVKTSHPLWDGWGGPGRDMLELLREAMKTQRLKPAWERLPARLAEGDAPTLLRRLQREIADGAPGVDTLAQDTSLQVVGAPGITREVETVYHAILHNLARDSTLRLSDVAVLVCDMATYKPVLQSVFGREPRRLPYNLSDSSAQEDSVYGAALLALLRLARGDFTRTDVFTLLLNPCLLAALRATPDDALAWANWAEALGIFRGFGAGRERVPFSWSQGLRRLRLGRVMAAPRAADGTALDHFAELVPFADFESSDQARVGAFSLAVEGVFLALDELREARDCRGWREALEQLMDRFLAVPPDRPREAGVRQGILRRLERLGEHDSLLGEGTKVGLPFIETFITENLSSIASFHGTYLSGGVTISSMKPMRPIPFRLIFVLGLGEGKFPGEGDRSTLDLRQRKACVGDVSLPQANRYMFLETLMSAREKLYLSYVSHDLQRDQVFQPCSVVNELTSCLGSRLAHEYGFGVTPVPLHGESERYLGCGEAAPWSDVLANYNDFDRLLLLQALREQGRLGDEAVLREHLEIRRHARLAVPPVDDVVERHVKHVRIRDLALFLENPLEAALKRRLGLYDDEGDDSMLARDEPFFSSFPIDYQIPMRVVEHCLRHGTQDWEAFLSRCHDDQQRRSLAPHGGYAELDLARFRGIAGHMAEGVALLQMQHNSAVRSVVMGDDEAREEEALRLPAPALDIDGVEVQLHGGLPHVWVRDEEWHAVIPAPKSRFVTEKGVLRKIDMHRGVVPAFLFSVAARAVGALTGPFVAHVLSGDGKTFSFTYFMTQEEAQDYVTSMLSDYLAPASFELLPLSLITSQNKLLQLLDDEDEKAFAEELAEEIDKAGDSAFSPYRPMALVSLLDARVPDNAWELARRRLGPLFDYEERQA